MGGALGLGEGRGRVPQLELPGGVGGRVSAGLGAARKGVGDQGTQGSVTRAVGSLS